MLSRPASIALLLNLAACLHAVPPVLVVPDDERPPMAAAIAAARGYVPDDTVHVANRTPGDFGSLTEQQRKQATERLAARVGQALAQGFVAANSVAIVLPSLAVPGPRTVLVDDPARSPLRADRHYVTVSRPGFDAARSRALVRVESLWRCGTTVCGGGELVVLALSPQGWVVERVVERSGTP